MYKATVSFEIMRNSRYTCRHQPKGPEAMETNPQKMKIPVMKPQRSKVDGT